MYEIVESMKGLTQEWRIVLRKSRKILLKTNNVAFARKQREILIERQLLAGKYIADKERITPIKCGLRIKNENFYAKLTLLVDGEEKLILVNKELNTQEEKEEMKSYGINLDRLYDIIEGYF